MEEDTIKPRQFDWLKLHLSWMDKIHHDALADTHKVISQESWEMLLGNTLDRYVASSKEFMEREIPLSFFLEEITE
jgi:hypothetical protein